MAGYFCECPDQNQVTQFAQQISARKARLIEEIRHALTRKGSERYADLVGDAGDVSAAILLRDVTEAPVRKLKARPDRA
ncbi:MAG: hypothetical protein HY661_01370 [Betaproteobacteria bacterium]|nr:hypothetical protein [Betaproteobacteria bacterium]